MSGGEPSPRSPGAQSWRQARATAHASAGLLPAVHLPLSACAGLTLAEPLRSLTPLPAFETAAMDGYAVAGDGPWQVVGRVLAGDLRSAPLRPGQAVETATGAAVPVGTTAVLPVEDARVRAGTVTGDVAVGRHLRRRGEECLAGDELLPAGTALGPAPLGLAAACGHDALVVRPRPRVAVLVTGTELLTSGLPRDGRVRDALGPQLRPLVAAYGGEVVDVRHLVDDREQLARDVEAAVTDVVVTTGASSVGPADHLHAVLAAAGAQVLVDGVHCRPGHPQSLARLSDGRRVVGLPGNPLAALVGAATLLAPLLAGMQGRPLPPLGCARLSLALAAVDGVTRLVPVAVTGGMACPVPHSGSAMLRGAALADALAVVPPGTSLPAGAAVELLPLPGG